VVTPLFVQLQADLGAAWRHIVFVGLQRHSRFARALEEGLAMAEHPAPPRAFPDLDKALEWCEDQLLPEKKLGHGGDVTVALADHATCKGLTKDEISVLESQTELRSFSDGTFIIRRGDEADGFYLLMRGEVSVTVDLPNGQQKRFSTLSAGMAFGELAVVDRSPRSADVRADSDVECRAVSIAQFNALGQTHPRIKMTILENLLRNVSRMVNRLNQEVAKLAL